MDKCMIVTELVERHTENVVMMQSDFRKSRPTLIGTLYKARNTRKMYNVIRKTKQTTQRDDATDMEKLASAEKHLVSDRALWLLNSAQMKSVVNMTNCIIVPAQIT